MITCLRTETALERPLAGEGHDGKSPLMRHWEKSVRLDQRAVKSFFDERARKVEQLGSIRAVIYQDHDADLALERHREEQEIILQKLNLNGRNHILDFGCGTGRWASVLVGQCAGYTGIDFCSGLLEVAQQTHRNEAHAEFMLASVADDLARLLKKKFDRILSLGVMIYLNDDEMISALNNMVAVAQDARARIVFREPVSNSSRMTLQDHFSTEMAQTYNAIYRSEPEFVDMSRSRLEPAGFRLVEQGDMYQSAHLNNRKETRQRWFVFDR